MRRMGTRLVTADELLRMPSEIRCELVRGEVRTMTPNGGEHGDIAQLLAERIGSHVRAHRLGKYYGPNVGFWIERGPDTVRAPDGAFVRAERFRGRGRNRGYIEGAPDLAIEILSPNDRRTRAVEKCRMWVAAGAATVVLIDPDRQAVTVFTADGESEVAADGSLTFGELIPGIAIALRDLFAVD
jgi:Uma2 family endonuclease